MGRTRVGAENGLSLGAKHSNTRRYCEHLQRRISPPQLQPEGPDPKPDRLLALNQRLTERDATPLAGWDGKARMSIAGVQDKLHERNFGSAEHGRNIREGVSFAVLFDRVEQTVNKAAARLILLRWALFQFLIGNSDAHGKNFSFFVRREGLEPAPWYDPVSVVQYPGIAHGLAMARGDPFKMEDVGAFAGQLRDFVVGQADQLAKLPGEAAKIKEEFL